MTTKDEVRSTERALKLALEALEGIWNDGLDGYPPSLHRNAITAIKEAMAAVPEAHKQSAEIPQSITCPFCESQHVPGWLHDYNMDRMEKPAPVAEPHKQQSAERVEKLLDTFKDVDQCGPLLGMGQPAQEQDIPKIGCVNHDCDQCKAQQQQETVAYAVYHRMGGSKTLHWPEQHSEDGDHNEYQLVPLYASPPANANAGKPWVPLTEFDIDQIPYSCSHADSRLIAFAIEAKLKEKNA